MTSREGAKDNNLNILRLVFAVMVIFSHSPHMIDRVNGRDGLESVFGTASEGQFAVDMFFVVSGFLIVKSYVQVPIIWAFSIKRIARIFPAYLVCFVLCYFCLSPMVGGTRNVFTLAYLGHFVTLTTRLLSPVVGGAFSGNPYPLLNGSMWTIAYEFRCYILVAILGSLGLLTQKSLIPIAVLSLACLGLSASGLLPESGTNVSLLGALDNNVRLLGVFSAGMAFYFLGLDKRCTHTGATIALFLLIIGLFSKWTAEFSIVMFGGYLVFWIGFVLRTTTVSRMADQNDISYGVYLYAWPIQNSLIFLNRALSPIAVSLITIAISVCFALLSWRLIERPSNKFARLLNHKSAKRMSVVPIAET